MIGEFSFTHLRYMVQAVGWTLLLSALAFVLGGIGGFIIMMMRISRLAVLRWLSIAYVECFQGIPLLIVLFIVYYGLSVYGFS